jgi:hypothetical protein
MIQVPESYTLINKQTIRDLSITTAFNNTSLKLDSICSFIPINSAISSTFALSYFHSLRYAEVSINKIFKKLHLEAFPVALHHLINVK